MIDEFRNLQFQKYKNILAPHSIFKKKNTMRHKKYSVNNNRRVFVLQNCFPKKTILKGQYDLINEIILFAIGLAITSFIIVNFSKIENTSSSLSINDSFKAVANQIANAVVKVYTTPNSSISIEIPDKIQEKVYSITLDDAASSVVLKTLDKPDIIISQQLFNISKRNYINNGGKKYTISRSVVSSAKFIEIAFENDEIIIRRSELPVV